MPYIMIAGLYGSGKSTLAQKIVTITDSFNVNSDIMRKRLGIEEYSTKHANAVWASIYAEVAKRLHREETVIVDAPFLDARTRLYDYMLGLVNQVPTLVIETHCSDQTLVGRLQSRGFHFGNHPGIDYESIVQKQARIWEPLTKDIEEFVVLTDHVSFMRYDSEEGRIERLQIRENMEGLVHRIENELGQKK